MTIHRDDNAKPGPREQRLTVENIEWEQAVDKPLRKERPAEGWPLGAENDRQEQGEPNESGGESN